MACRTFTFAVAVCLLVHALRVAFATSSIFTFPLREFVAANGVPRKLRVVIRRYFVLPEEVTLRVCVCSWREGPIRRPRTMCVTRLSILSYAVSFLLCIDDE